MSDTVIETSRLIIRKWRATDLPAMIAINEDPKVMEFLGPRSREQTEQFIQGNIEQYARRGYCLYPVELKDTHEFIGWVGLNLADFASHFTPAVEIGWRIGSQYWGKGYATEAALVIRDFAFNALGLEELVSFTVPANARSIRLMERLGFIRNPVDDFDHPAFTGDHPLRRHVLYRRKK